MNRFLIRRRQLLLAIAGAGLPPSQVSALVNGRDHTDSVPKLAVCLGSGGRHGYVHIGVIRAFDRFGLKPNIVCGTSAGAIAGVLWAAGHAPIRSRKLLIFAFYATDGAGKRSFSVGSDSTARKIRVAATDRLPNSTLKPHVPCTQATKGSVDAITENDTMERSA